MNISVTENMHLALSAVWTHRFRSLLTILGIVIGITTVVEDGGLELLLPAAVDGNPITARVPGYESDTINVTGRSPNMEDIEPRDFAAGRFYTSEENHRSAHVAVIGASVAEALFPDGHGVGRAIMMDGAE